MAVGGFHSLALDRAGTLWVWGNNSWGQLGVGDLLDRRRPIPVLSEVKALAAGWSHSLAIKTDGSLWVWGDNTYGQLGLGAADETPHPTPHRVENFSQVVTVAGGWRSTLVLREDGTVWAFGKNDSGALGDGTYADHFSPALAENDTLDGVLDLDPATPNQIPDAAQPTFLVNTEKAGNAAAMDLSVDVGGLLATPPLGAAAEPVTYNIYVAGNLPSAGDQGWWELRPDYAWNAWFFGSPLLGFLHNQGLTTAYDRVRLDILRNADLSQGAGASIYVGYGVDSNEMITSRRFRKVLDVISPDNTKGYYVLTINKTGNGTVTAQPNVICGNQCSASYLPGTPVTLLATPDAGMTLTSWGGACASTGKVTRCTLKMDAEKAVSVTFAKR
ncbi:hypothetical protein CCP4SC76_1780002 [Gammaproteobacteria bacterium]